MSYWTGTEWAAEPTPSPKRPSRMRHILEAILEGSLVALLVVGLLAGTTFAGRGGGKGNAPAATAQGCVVDGSVVTASGLPTDQVLNFFVSDATGKTGWVLGFTDDGTWATMVPERHSSTTYEFASRTWGPNGSHYDVFASCTAA